MAGNWKNRYCEVKPVYKKIFCVYNSISSKSEKYKFQLKRKRFLKFCTMIADLRSLCMHWAFQLLKFNLKKEKKIIYFSFYTNLN